MIKVDCFICDRELDRAGAILLSPPDKSDRVIKRHICDVCYALIMKVLRKGIKK